jgi:hypothetical protein
MSEKLVHQITLDCLINKEIFDKHKSIEKTMKINKKDKKFYRKRILNLTRELLLSDKNKENQVENENENKSIIPPDLLYAFNNYVKTCISNFKTIDKNDIIQEEYNAIDLSCNVHNDLEVELKNIEVKTQEDNKLFMRSIKTKKYLDDFVKYKYIKKEEDMILPKMKDINLKEPNLRNKGIKKKENIPIIYDENTQK